MVSPSIKLPSDKGKAASAWISSFSFSNKTALHESAIVYIREREKRVKEKSEKRLRPRNGESIAAIVLHHEGLFASAKKKQKKKKP